MEKEKNIYLYPLNSEWNDIGSWDSFAEIFKEESSITKLYKLILITIL